MQLCECLRELRQERGLRLIDITEKAGMSVSYLSDLERGRTNPSLETLQTLADAYGITVHDLLGSVEFSGESTVGTLPQGLAELVSAPVLGAPLTPDWVRTLSRIELRGKRPKAKDDWLNDGR